MKQIIAFLLPLFLFVSCEYFIEDQSFDNTIMPEETTKGAETFGCLIDGWIYAGGRYKRTWKDYHDDYSSHLFLYDSEKNIMTVSVLVEGSKYIDFTILDPQEREETIYIDAYFYDEEIEDGQVYITRFDKRERIISGRFEGDRMTNGRFDVHYIIEK